MIFTDKSLFCSSFMRYCLVGLTGFMIDALFLQLLVTVVDFHPLPARIVSMPLSMSLTWFWNRIFTFQSRNPGVYREWVTYGLLGLIGAGINYGVYALCLMNVAIFYNNPLIPLTIAALVTFVFNYNTSRFIVFNPTARIE